MSTETGFHTAWLEERFVFDSNARNKLVEKAFRQHFDQKQSINILDLGAGSGSSFLYLAEKLPMHQQWTFVELNPDLVAAAIQRILNIADQKKWIVLEAGEVIRLRLSGKDVSIKVINGSFLELPELVDVKSFDLATAAAVLDLLTLEMLHELLKVLAGNQVALLATINYAGMGFEPEEPGDKYYAALYSQHMQREQAFGKTLGADCTQAITDYCAKKELTSFWGESNWFVKPEDKRMHRFLLDYMNDAIPEMLKTEPELEAFQTWLDTKKEMLENGLLSTTVFHRDIFLMPG